MIAGCDGSFGPSRKAIPAGERQTWERTYPYSWLGVLADIAPSTDELIYAWHPDGFALHSMRSLSVSRLYLQVPPDTDLADWPDDRVWEALATRLGEGQDGWHLTPGPIVDKSVLPMHSFVMSPMRCGRLFLAGDAAHIVPPTGAKGLNLAIADVALLASGAAQPVDRRRPVTGGPVLREGAPPGMAVQPLLVVDDDDAAPERGSFRCAAATRTAAMGSFQPCGRHGTGRELRRSADRILMTLRSTCETGEVQG